MSRDANRIYLSPPHVGRREAEFLKQALDSNWIAPVGPFVDRFERAVAQRTGVAHAVALSSGTAAIHLGLKAVGVSAGDSVLCSTLTFVASANPIRYLGAEPVFIDCESASWNMDPDLLVEALDRSAAGLRPRAVVITDVFGQCADYGRLGPLCREAGIPVIEDAAEALGATCGGAPAGSFGDVGIMSFNGNKVVTASSGGMLLTDDTDWARSVRFWAAQSRDPSPHYEHTELGYNYRLSNILAALGCAQLERLEDRIEARRRIYEYYRSRLEDLPGLSFMPEAPWGRSTRWLTCVQIDPSEAGTDREQVRLALEAHEIEARPVWKPLHLQPLFDGCRILGGSVATRIFDEGLCLPSGSSLTDADLDRIVGIVAEGFPG